MRALLVVLLSAAMFLAATPGRAEDADWRDCVQEADHDLQIRGCTSVLARGDNETPARRAIAYMNRGNAYFAKGEKTRAIADYDEAIRIDPKLAMAYYNRGVAYSAKGDPTRAVADYDEAIRIDPKDAMAYFSRGVAYSTKGDQSRAISDYDEAIRIDPKDAMAYFSRGVAYSTKGDQSRAIADYDEAIRIDPKLAMAYYNRGVAYSAKGDQFRAISDFDEVIRLDPKLAIAYSGRGSAYYAKGDKDRAISDYDDAIRLDPKAAWLYHNRGSVYGDKGDQIRAISDYDAAIRLDPELASAYSARGRAYYAKGDKDRAISDFDEAIRLDPKDAIVYAARGFAIYYAKSDLDRAIADYDEAIRLDPTNADTLGMRGRMHEKRRDLARARADFEAAIAVRPGDRVGVAGLKRLRAMAAEMASGAAASAAPARQPAAPHNVERGKRVALVIGNNAYPRLPADRQLRNAVNDARTVGQALESIGFSVTVEENLGREKFLDALSKFSRLIERGDTAFFFFSGHGVSLHGGANYLLPSDFPASRAGDKDEEQRLVDRALAERGVIDRMQGAGARVAMVVLDACRDNPLALANQKSVGATRGLAPPPAVEGVMSIYSAGLGQSALDRLSDADSDKNSVFTRVFVEMLKTPGLTHREVAVKTREKVKALARNAGYSQTPGYYEEIDGDVFLAGR